MSDIIDQVRTSSRRVRFGKRNSVLSDYEATDAAQMVLEPMRGHTDGTLYRQLRGVEADIRNMRLHMLSHGRDPRVRAQVRELSTLRDTLERKYEDSKRKGGERQEGDETGYATDDTEPDVSLHEQHTSAPFRVEYPGQHDTTALPFVPGASPDDSLAPADVDVADTLEQAFLELEGTKEPTPVPTDAAGLQRVNTEQKGRISDTLTRPLAVCERLEAERQVIPISITQLMRNIKQGDTFIALVHQRACPVAKGTMKGLQDFAKRLHLSNDMPAVEPLHIYAVREVLPFMKRASARKPSGTELPEIDVDEMTDETLLDARGGPDADADAEIVDALHEAIAREPASDASPAERALTYRSDDDDDDGDDDGGDDFATPGVSDAHTYFSGGDGDASEDDYGSGVDDTDERDVLPGDSVYSLPSFNLKDHLGDPALEDVFRYARDTETSVTAHAAFAAELLAHKGQEVRRQRPSNRRRRSVAKRKQRSAARPKKAARASTTKQRPLFALLELSNAGKPGKEQHHTTTDGTHMFVVTHGRVQCIPWGELDTEPALMWQNAEMDASMLEQAPDDKKNVFDIFVRKNQYRRDGYVARVRDSPLNEWMNPDYEILQIMPFTGTEEGDRLYAATSMLDGFGLSGMPPDWLERITWADKAIAPDALVTRGNRQEHAHSMAPLEHFLKRCEGTGKVYKTFYSIFPSLVEADGGVLHALHRRYNAQVPGEPKGKLSDAADALVGKPWRFFIGYNGGIPVRPRFAVPCTAYMQDSTTILHGLYSLLSHTDELRPQVIAMNHALQGRDDLPDVWMWDAMTNKIYTNTQVCSILLRRMSQLRNSGLQSRELEKCPLDKLASASAYLSCAMHLAHVPFDHASNEAALRAYDR